MMAAILNSTFLKLAMVDSAILHKTLTQTNLIWLKFIHSHSNWWLQPSWILPCWIQTMPSWIQTPCYLLSDSFKNTLTPLWLWLKLIQSDSNSFILAQLDDGSHLEFCHLEFGHLVFCHLNIFFQTDSHLPRLVAIICTKNFTHSFWLNLMMAAILNSAIMDSAILHKTLTQTNLLSWRLKLIHSHSNWWLQPSWNLLFWILHVGFSHLSISFQTHSHLPGLVPTICTKKLHSFILTQLDDGSHLEFCHVGLRHCHLGFRHLVIFSQIHSKTLSLHSDSDSN